MKAGDYTELAKDYRYRPDYSSEVLNILVNYIRCSSFEVADIGAGTGKLTRQLADSGLSVTAVEPNDAMRSEGIKYTDDFSINWKAGTAEKTSLSDNHFQWVTMASAFHWTDPMKSLPEFARILKPGGFLTVMWNPRDLQRSKLHMEIENRIYSLAPDIKRKSSGAVDYTSQLETTLVRTGHFQPPIFIEAQHDLVMSKERYMTVWRSVNDIQVQAGAERWQKILGAIEEAIRDLDMITVPYRTRSWTVRKQTDGV